MSYRLWSLCHKFQFLNVINREKLYIRLHPLASLLHGQTMVEDMVDHSGPNLIRDNSPPPYSHSSSSSSSSSSYSYPHSSASLISSTFHVVIHCSPNQELTCGPYIAKALIPNGPNLIRDN